jgi:hypothetical protein
MKPSPPALGACMVSTITRSTLLSSNETSLLKPFSRTMEQQEEEQVEEENAARAPSS